MESEDDMHDASELTSAEEEDDYYSGGDDDIGDGDAEEDYNYGDDDDNTGDYDFMPNDSDADEVSASRAQNYTVLKEEDIWKIQGEDIMRISNVLSISREAACILLHCYKWNVNDVHEQWFADEGRVRKSVGLFEKPVVQYLNAREVTCGICFDNYSHELVRSAACGHPFCDSCWKGLSTIFFACAMLKYGATQLHSSTYVLNEINFGFNYNCFI
ncbi:probable E3 ubiquitin-protein ligase ARI8 isoform X2 [Olea europaea var. sylvestris]|uniref:probable E3 ubiquitin-protein ligase ARI8 isoform X2 n=1 Tax=Olea europaea var. sylvestris TaxID=158386 RepID=UPI000C1D22E4|nr:probable E3 ubiquitin-protein ligase ARI8 isoform X2 [Olea europaea var. sylvestris]